jgi:hypothetical protein
MSIRMQIYYIVRGAEIKHRIQNTPKCPSKVYKISQSISQVYHKVQKLYRYRYHTRYCKSVVTG